jgi:S-ribosylhomocysteine lyase LuxS involved in autoinducer biosynthesis
MDIKETLEVIDFGMSVANGVYVSLKNDGKITAADAVNFMPALMALPAALEGADKVPAELGELSDVELGQIRDHILQKLPDIGEKWIVVAKESFTIAMSAYRIFFAFQAPKT